MEGHRSGIKVGTSAVFVLRRIDQYTKYLILVGGFGDSQYLRRELRRTFGELVELLLANEPT
jgi:hypothetical protein